MAAHRRRPRLDKTTAIVTGTFNPGTDTFDRVEVQIREAGGMYGKGYKATSDPVKKTFSINFSGLDPTKTYFVKSSIFTSKCGGEPMETPGDDETHVTSGGGCGAFTIEETPGTDSSEPGIGILSSAAKKDKEPKVMFFAKVP